VATFGTFAALTGAAVLAVVLFGHYPFWKRALETFVWRLDIWNDAWIMLRENSWLLVTGDGTALLASSYSRVGYPNPHNMFIYFLIEYGIVGSGLFFTFLFLRMRRLRASLQHSVETRPEAQALFWGLLLFLAMGLVDDMVVQTQITALIFFHLGILMRLAEHSGDEEARKEETVAAGTGAVA
jgi:O-antigen ligase